MSFILILFTFIIILLVSWFVKYHKYEKFLKNVPGPTPLPIIGNILYFRSTSDMLDYGLKFRKKYGGMVKIRIGFNNPNIFISDPKAIEFVLGSTRILSKPFHYEYLHPWLGTGLLTSEGNKWKKHRKMLTPAFHFGILEQFVPIFNSYSKILVDKLQAELGNPSFDVYPYITLFSLDVICATSMGTNVNAQRDSDSKYVQNVKEMCRIMATKMISIIRAVKYTYVFTEDYDKEKIALDSLHKYTNGVIAKRKFELAEKTENVTQTDEMGIKRKLTFLDLMLQYKMEKNDITDEEIRQEVDTFTFEGHDTTASGISFTLFCLSQNLDVQEKVMEELKFIFSDDWSRSTTYQDLQEMKYLEMTIKEALRLYPSVPKYSRTVKSDIEYNGITFPTGTTITVFPFVLHRCPSIYPDPERFDPERFTLEEQQSRSLYTYVPFSAGPRNCIGQKFAMLEIKSVVSAILRNYKILPTFSLHVPELAGELVLKSKNGIHIRLKKRENNS